VTSLPGLCATCAWARAVVTRKGGRFTLCARAEDDPRFEKYPGLPVLACGGYEPRLLESRDSNEDPSC
jgi:hypothetical protein